MYPRNIEDLHNSFIKYQYRRRTGEKRVNHKIIKNKKALSPVIATVILVSVTIVVAIAVSYWMGGIAGLYTRFEQIEITSCNAVKEGGIYNITSVLKNTGSQDSTIDNIIINGQLYTAYGANVTVLTIPTTIPLGTSRTIIVSINQSLWESGTTVNLQFHSAAGKDYPRMLALP
jgi:flagellin-like protein